LFFITVFSLSLWEKVGVRPDGAGLSSTLFLSSLAASEETEQVIAFHC
jgi:hypothetical protein